MTYRITINILCVVPGEKISRDLYFDIHIKYEIVDRFYAYYTTNIIQVSTRCRSSILSGFIICWRCTYTNNTKQFRTIFTHHLTLPNKNRGNSASWNSEQTNFITIIPSHRSRIEIRALVESWPRHIDLSVRTIRDEILKIQS